MGQLEAGRYGEVPTEIADLISYFWQIDRGRNVVPGFGVSPISWQDVQAWANLTGINLEQWEIKAIFRLDDAALTFRANSKKQSDEPSFSMEGFASMLEGSRQK